MSTSPNIHISQLEPCGPGAWCAPGARIVDHSGRKVLPIGHDGFERVAESFVFVDKTMLIADVLDSGYAATLFCRPRRFGKTLNMTMMKVFLENAPDGRSRSELFHGTEIWEADGGRYREHQGVYPVVHLSFNTVKKSTWEAAYGSISQLISDEFGRHAYLMDSPSLDDVDRGYFDRIRRGAASSTELSASLTKLCHFLCRHHNHRVVLLIDEYDAPVMAGYSAPDGGYYHEVVDFLKGWLTGAIKDGGQALAFACLTGVQRISKESIFSDLNNLRVSTALDSEFNERFGFTESEVAALSAYLGYGDHLEEARTWYDGYCFGAADVYNPWSLLNYLRGACTPDIYWGNTSGNSVVGDLVHQADASTLEQLYALLEPGGSVTAPLDLTTVFPDLGIKTDAIWSMLYLSGYLTTSDTAFPNSTRMLRRLRIPNYEVSELYRTEIVERFAAEAGGTGRLNDLHTALIEADAERATMELTRIARNAASYHDLTSENGCHMLLLGLCFGMPGYADPVSNREHGCGRPDLQIAPMRSPFAWPARPLITIEIKFAKTTDESRLTALAQEGLAQIAERAYDEEPLPPETRGRVRWGIAFGNGRVMAASQTV